MQRVAFLLPSGERIACLLNPEHLEHRRLAGLRPLATGSGSLSGRSLSDTPLLHTGGGRTEIDLALLFDVQLVRSGAPVAELPAHTSTGPDRSAAETDGPPMGPQAQGPRTPSSPMPVAPPAPDVRDLTRPLWNLAENSAHEGRGVPQVRFVWGKAWNVLAVVESFAERLERFSPGGAPGRSWVRMRLVRVPDPAPAALGDPTESSGPIPDPAAAPAAATTAVHTVIGAGDATGSGAGGETLPEIAAAHLDGRAWLWRWVAAANDLDDVIWPEAGSVLSIPAAPQDTQAGAL